MKLRLLIPLVVVLVSVAARADEKLPSDPAILTGELENGVTWMYRQHNNPPGKMALMINVKTGSLNETDSERGLSHFMEHMMFNGTQNYAPGELIDYFESIGMEFGADLNAFTSVDQTAYQIFLPNVELTEIDRALLTLSDYAFRALLLEEEINKERAVILEEKRARTSMEMRVMEKLWPQLFEGSRLAERIPIGTEEVISGAPRAAFEKYYRTWYRPERVTVLMVGDTDPEPVLPLVKKHFGAYEAPLPDGAECGPEFKFFKEPRAIIVTDPEMTDCELEMMNLLPARPPSTTVPLLRADLVEAIASWIVNRRFDERLLKGEATYRSAGAGISSMLGGAMIGNAAAQGEPTDWKAMLEEMIVELNRARKHGTTPRELALAAAEFRASAEREVRTEATRNARAIIGEMNESVADGEPILSAQQFLDLFDRLIPTVTAEEVNAVISRYFKPGAFSYVIKMPELEGLTVPSRDDLLAAARAAHAIETEALAAAEESKDLLAAPPEPGKVVEKTFEEDLAVTSAWLDNGVRVHHRFMDYKKDSVYVGISLAGGLIEETEATAGVTQVAGLVVQQPATNRLGSTEIKDLLTGKNISVQGGPSPDAFSLVVSGSPKDLETGLQLAHALLTDGKIEKSAFDTWQPAMRQQLEHLQKVPEFRGYMALMAIAGGGDHRLLAPTLEQLDMQTIEAGQAWYDRLCAKAPIEVAVVGEITLEDAMGLIERYVGSLPSRPRTASHLDRLRKFDRPEGPWHSEVSVETITPKAVAYFGFLGPDRLEIGEYRALAVASQTLSTRANEVIREQKGLVYSIEAQNIPLDAFDDSSLVFTGAPCEPANATKLIEAAEEIFTAFAKEGPTAEELENAKKQTLNNVEVRMKEPRYWFGILQHLDLHQVKLDDQKQALSVYGSLTAERIRDVFAKYYKPDRLFTINVQPAD